MQSTAVKLNSPQDMAAAFMAFAADATTSKILREAADRCGFDEMAVAPVHHELEEVLDTLRAIPTPKILVVDMSGSENLLNDVNALANTCDQGCRVIIIGRVNDVNVYRSMMDQGVHEYLVKPVSLDRVVDAVRRIKREPSSGKSANTTTAAEPLKSIRRMAFLGVHGGAGASSLAANVAWGLSMTHAQRISLIDLDLTFGTLAVQLDTEPGKGLVDALVTPSRVDELFLKRALIPYTDTLHLLASEADPGNMIDVNARAISVLFEHMREAYDTAVLDLPRDLLVRQPAFINVLDEILMVSEPTLVGLRDATRIARLIRANKPDVVVNVILNRVGLSPNSDLTAEMFAKNSGLEIIGEVPFDAKASALATAKGRVMLDIDANSKAAVALRSLIDRLSPVDGDGISQKSLWNRLMKRG